MTTAAIIVVITYSCDRGWKQSLLSFTSTQRSLLQLRFNGSLALRWDSKMEQAVRHQLWKTSA